MTTPSPSDKRTGPRPNYPKQRVSKTNRGVFDQGINALVESGCYAGHELIQKSGLSRAQLYKVLDRLEIVPVWLTKKQRMKILNGALK